MAAQGEWDEARKVADRLSREALCVLRRFENGRGIDLIAADNPGSFIDDTPTARLVRQVLGAISEFDKAMTVAKLRGARERKRRETGKCEGRKSYGELRPELVELARRLRRPEAEGRPHVAACDLGRAGGARLPERKRPTVRCCVG
jgi:DNA invertase Pin-like site-specific DNA recombinase